MESPLRASDATDFRLIETFGYLPGQAGKTRPGQAGQAGQGKTETGNSETGDTETGDTETGVARLSLHLARMARSAAAFGIAFDPAAVIPLIRDLGARPLRCRLTLSAAGELALTTGPMPPVPRRWRFAIAGERLEADDPDLRHKTTRRARYDRARAALPEGLDELVFLNTRGEVCEGTISNIAITTATGERLTPPLVSGCLPGVFRQSLLDSGALREARLTLADLRQAREICLMNALRGAIPAVLQPPE